jgi:transcription initiation factor IIE alpha subunit
MNHLGRFLELLADGKWHDAEDLSLKLGVPIEKLRRVIQLLSGLGIVSSSDDRARLDDDLRKLFEET